MDPEQAAQQIQALTANVAKLTGQNEEQLNHKTRNGSELPRIRMRKNNLEELKEMIMKRSQIVKLIEEQGHQKKIHPGWKVNSATRGEKLTNLGVP